MRRLAALLFFLAAALDAQPRIVASRGDSPLINFRVVFRTGAASDPAGKPGVASLTAAMLAEGGTRELTYKQIVDALFPMAASVESNVDKEMTVFFGSTHVDNLESYYALLRSMLLDPGWREDDLKRLKDNIINYLRVSLRGNNDEELGKEVLYSEIFEGHPYEHNNAGSVSSISKLTLDDLKAFYKTQYTQGNLTIGIAGGYPNGFEERVKKDFSKLTREAPAPVKLAVPKAIEGLRATIVKKETRSVAYSMGFPLDVRRGHPDYPALLLAQSWLGQHRLSGGRLFQRIREVRGINYGNYAYIEHFPNGMFRFEPETNLARRQQIFEIWIRPVETANAHFTLRLAMFELERMIKQGISEEEFQQSRSFLSKYVNLMTKTKLAELGYSIDSQFYGIGDYSTYVKGGLAKLTRDDVNRAIRKYLHPDRMIIVAVAADAEGLKAKLLANAPSPIVYNSPKPEDVLAEDKLVQSLKLPIEAVKIVPVEKIFE
jgi:zinc protease